MKRNPTLEEKKIMSRLGLNPGDWLVKKHCSDGMHLLNKFTGTKKVIPPDLSK